MSKRECLILLAVYFCFCVSACKHTQTENSGVKHEISATPRGQGAIQPGDCKPGSAFNSIKKEADYADAARYVESIAKSIIDANPSVFKDDLSFDKFCFYVIRDDEFNAFATPPSANVVFHDTMLIRMRNDAEVATKLAHELAHLTMNLQANEQARWGIRIRFHC